MLLLTSLRPGVRLVNDVHPANEPALNSAAETRPRLRGYVHLGAAVVAPGALAVLLLIADSPRDFVGSSIFGASLILMYTTSTAYHLIPWSAANRSVARALDHSMIFVLIAGTCTPFALKLLDNGWGFAITSVVWVLAGAGMLLNIIAPNAPRRLRVSIYIAIGWFGLVPVILGAASMTTAAVMLLTAGGLLYSAGGVIYAIRWPDPIPGVFGFHEVFHSMVVLASGVFWFVIATHVLAL